MKLFTVMLLLLTPLSATAESWPLQFDAGPEWNIEYQGEGTDFFSFTRPKGENLLFILHKWPTKGGPEQVPVYVKKIADNFSENTSWFTLPGMAKEKYEMDSIPGEAFSGEAAVFESFDKTLLVILMVSDGDGIWNGQYSGSKEMWGEVKRLLGTMQRAGD
jgi:hypothetical protein